jgi:outer membrane lipoprotein-sorting protein
MKHRIWMAFGLLLVLSLALAGCGDRITAEEIVARMQETVEDTQDAHAVVSASMNVQGIELSATAEVWEKSPNKVRAEVLEASEPDLVGSIVVSDGQQGWAYEAARNVVRVGSAGEIETPLPEEMLTELRDVIQAVLDASDVELAGEETVVGREAYKLTLSPKEDAEQSFFPGGGTATLWVDQEQWIVLKAEYAGGTFGQGSLEVQSFELNPGLSDDLFTFTVPEGATVVDVEAQAPVPLTLDEAREQAGFPLLVPEYVPAGATLIEVFQVEDSFLLRYDHSPEVSFTVIQGPELASPPPLGQAQNVSVRGQSGTAITDEAGGTTFLYWTEGAVTVTVAGRISLDEALQVADSLE